MMRNCLTEGEFMIKEYMPQPNNYHKCVDKQGREFNVDLFVAACRPDGETNESVVGRKVLILDAQVYLSIADELELLPIEQALEGEK